MKVDYGKIRLSTALAQNLKDGSVRYVFYKEPAEGKQLLELKPSWGTTYQLSVNLPLKRDLETVVIVTRTSVNCYRVIISTPNGTELANCKTYDEVNEAIKSLVK